MTIRRTVLAGLLSIGLLQVGAQAQEDVIGDLQACLGGMSEAEAEALFEGLAERHDRLAAERDIEAQLGALCTAGDRDGAEALWADYEAELYTTPEERLAQQCLEAQIEAMRAHLSSLGMDIGEKPHVCEGEF
jgi:phage shock protein A